MLFGPGHVLLDTFHGSNALHILHVNTDSLAHVLITHLNRVIDAGDGGGVCALVARTCLWPWRGSDLSRLGQWGSLSVCEVKTVECWAESPQRS